MVMGKKEGGEYKMSNITNVILITIDAFRADHLSCLGYTRDTTPNMDYLANKGVLFAHAISNAPYTSASVTSFLTSTYPLMYGGYTKLSKERTTIAEVLKENGYSTAAFQSNPWIKQYRLGKDFDIFEDPFKDKDILNKAKKKIIDRGDKNSKIYKFLRKAYHLCNFYKVHLYMPYARAEIINKKAISWLRLHSNNFFLWLHYMDVHYPYNPPKKFLGLVSSNAFNKKEKAELNKKMFANPGDMTQKELERLIELYDSEISYTDWAIGMFLKELEKMDLLESTFIIITADHGVEFNEHGGMGLVGNNRPTKLYDELLHVPLIICGPGIKEKTIIKDQVSLLNLAPTIIELLGVSKPDNFLGKMLIPLIGGEGTGDPYIISEGLQAKDPNSTLYIDPGRRIISCRTEKWKYIFNETTEDELYNLQNDPCETKNIVEKDVEKAEEFESKIKDHLLMEKETMIDVKEKISKKIKELKNLGKI